MRPAFSLLVGIVLLPACDMEATGNSGVTVADSAGVEIVWNDESAWAAGDAWYLPGAPRLEVGAIEGEHEYQFDRLIGAVTLSNSRIVVADMGSSEVRLFDETGQHVRSMGGAGDGPGEFRQITDLHRLPDDRLAVEPTTPMAGLRAGRDVPGGVQHGSHQYADRPCGLS